ncbi:MAG TPA: hypothetical protein VMG10_36155 [Gemmataceae bacterium]|nr:hypothetical protein [Gemmataceae bacterium]
MIATVESFREPLAFTVVQVGNGFDILAIQLGEESLDVVVGVGLLLGRLQGVEEGLQEGLQSWQDAAEQGRWDVGIVEQFVQADTKTSFHR